MKNQLAISLVTCLLSVVVCLAQDEPAETGAAPTDRTALIRLLNQKLSEAAAARNAGDWNRAIAILEEASGTDPSRDLLWFKLGDAYRGADRYSDAVTAYRKAILIKPFAPYYNNLAEAERKLGNFRSAVDAYRAAVQVDPQNAYQYYFNIGAVETNSGNVDAANAAYDEAIRANPGFAMPYYFKGLNVLIDSQTLHGKAAIPFEAPRVFHKYLELAADGPYAALTRQTLEFIAADIATTYSRTGSADRPSADRDKREALEDSSEAVPDTFILRRVQPSYPQLARNARIQGPVILDALISEDGDILRLGVLSGNPFLVPAALDAVKQWKYKLFTIKDQPTKVHTQILVNFELTSEAQPGPIPLRLSEILQLVQNGLARDGVTSLIRHYKVGFDITDSSERQLREAGANDEVVQAVKSSRP
jgi:TonB family protein